MEAINSLISNVGFCAAMCLLMYKLLKDMLDRWMDSAQTERSELAEIIKNNTACMEALKSEVEKLGGAIHADRD